MALAPRLRSSPERRRWCADSWRRPALASSLGSLPNKETGQRDLAGRLLEMPSAPASRFSFFIISGDSGGAERTLDGPLSRSGHSATNGNVIQLCKSRLSDRPQTRRVRPGMPSECGARRRDFHSSANTLRNRRRLHAGPRRRAVCQGRRGPASQRRVWLLVALQSHTVDTGLSLWRCAPKAERAV